MTTENQIQVNLQRFKKGKQNLGAIEDIIEEQRQFAQELENKMKSAYIQLEDEYASTLDAISGDVENLASTRTSLFSEFERYYVDYSALVDGLRQYIDFDESIGIEISNNFTDMDENINNLQQSVMQTLKF